VIDKLVGPKFEKEQCADKGGNAIGDDFAVDNLALVKSYEA